MEHPLEMQVAPMLGGFDPWGRQDFLMQSPGAATLTSTTRSVTMRLVG